MSAGSWLRYIFGIVLSIDVLRVAFANTQIQPSTIALAIIFLILAMLYVVKRI